MSVLASREPTQPTYSDKRTFLDFPLEESTVGENERHFVNRTVQTEITGDTLRVSGLTRLDQSNAVSVREMILEAFREDMHHIHFDLSTIVYIDPSGLGVLIALRNAAKAQKGTMILFRPRHPEVQKTLDVTRMHRIFEIAGT